MERTVSPGVFTNENDLSYLPQGVSAIGAAIIGPTPMGPAFIPTLIETQNDYTAIFGEPDGETYVPYTVQNYLKNAGRVTVVRVVNLEGYKADALGIELTGTATAQNIIFALSSSAWNPNASASQFFVDSLSNTTKLFGLKSGSTTIATASIDPSSSLWLPYVIGSTVASASALGYPVYVSQSFSSYASDIVNMAMTSSITSTTAGTFTANTGSFGTISVTSSITLNTSHKTLTVLAATDSLTNITSSWNATQVSGLGFVLSASNSTVSYSLSFDPESANYITNVFGENAEGTKDFYVYANYPERHALIADLFTTASVDSTTITTATYDCNAADNGIQLSSSLAYVEAITPWIQSQTINSTNINLFRFHTINTGLANIKISISDIKMPAEMPTGVVYGTFTVLVREVDDTDSRPVVLETYSGCTLDPDSTNYVARKIGDRYNVYSEDSEGNSKLYTYGDFANKSKYVYIEMNTDDTIPTNAMPYGFDNYTAPIAGCSTLPDVTFKTTQMSGGEFSYRTYLGFDFTDDDNDWVFEKPTIPTDYTPTATSAFTLENCKMANAAGTAEVTFETTSSAGTSTNGKKARKFSLAFQGGFDGLNPTVVKTFGTTITSATNVMGYNLSIGASGYNAFKKAIDTVSNPDEFDINMMVLPGITNDLASGIISYASNACEERGDVFLLFDDVVAAATINEAVDAVAGLDTNYAATYYPWVKIYDQYAQKYIWVPPSVVMAGVISFNDRVAAEWWAPAGLNRGGLDVVTQVYNRLTQAERDDLYEGRVNPIAAFAGLGFAAWGQKTLQLKSSALDRINVRRLLIALKKYIASASKYLVFEQNTVATRTRFLNIVNPYLASVQQKQGLYAFKCVMSEENNTPDVIDRNILKGEIYIQPTKTAEFIVIDFNVLPTGATFSS